MIYLELSNLANLSFLPDALVQGIQFITEKVSDKNLPTGKYEIDGDDVYANVMDYQTEDASNKQAEVHLDYIDIQALIMGTEEICFGDSVNWKQIDGDYQSEGDYALLDNIDNQQSMRLRPGVGMIFLPGEVHKPGCSINAKSENVRKVVVKVHKKKLGNFRQQT